MSTPKQNLVGAAGVGLVLVGAWTGNVHKEITGGLFHGGSADQAHTGLKTVAVELVAVAIMTVIAGASDGAGNLMLVLVVALGILFAINNPHPFTSSTQQPQTKGA